MKSLLLIAVATLGLTTATMAQVPNYVPTNGLVGWWPFNGNANDQSGNGYISSTTVNSFVNDRFGLANAAVDLSSQNNTILTNYAGILGQNSRTVNLWFKILSTTGNSPQLFAYGAGFGTGWNMLLINSHPTIDNSNSEIQYNPTVNSQTWHMFTATYDASFGSNTLAVKLFIDGTLLTIIHSNYNGAQNLNTAAGNPVGFGWGGPSNTLIDDIGMWNRVLTQQEITDLFNAVNCASITTITPQTNSLTTGSTATFTASTSDPNPGYVWQSNFGQGFQTLNNVGNYSGANTGTLNINNVQLLNHTQPIRVISTSGNCIDTSNVAVINIVDTCITSVTVYDTLLTTVTDTLVINATLTGLNPPVNQNTLKVFPNPARTHITIDYGNVSLMSGYTLKIVNALGATVFSAPINQQTSYINLSTWTGNGIYYVQLINPQNNTIENRKIVIQ